MRNLIMQLFMVAVFGSLIFTATSCKDNEPVIPVPEVKFPETKTLQLVSGDTASFSFDVIADWKLTISPAEASQWFYIQDGTHKVTSLSNKLGSYKVILGAEDDEDFEQRSCEIVMTMEGKSKTVAQVIRNGIERTMTVYLCKYSTSGAISTTQGKINFETTPMDADAGIKFNLQSSISDKSIYHEFAIRVVSNSDWKLSTYPEWVDKPANPAGNAGDTVSLSFKIGEYGKLPLDDMENLIGFTALNENEESVTLRNIKLVSPGVRNLFNLSTAIFNGTLKIDNDGRYFNENAMDFQQLKKSFSSMKEQIVFYKMNYNLTTKQFEEKGTEWLTVLPIWGANTSTTIQQNSYTITASSNEGNINERIARVIAVPKYISETITDPIGYFFTADKSEVKDEFSKNVLARITQSNCILPTLALKNSEGAKAEGTTLTELKKTDVLYQRYLAIFEASSSKDIFPITDTTIFYHLHYTKSNPVNSLLQCKETFTVNIADDKSIIVKQITLPGEYEIKMDTEKINANPDKNYVMFYNSARMDGLKFLLICTSEGQ